MKAKQYISLFITVITIIFFVVFAYSLDYSNEKSGSLIENPKEDVKSKNIEKNNDEENSIISTVKPFSKSLHNKDNFIYASKKSINTVVHIKSTIIDIYYDPFAFFFGSPTPYVRQEKVASGSGVIVSKDGYIVTNNHVINDAESISVVLNDKREFPAKILGSDPETDLALLKIDSKGDLDHILFANSDDTEVGEWVIAVGNPYNLTSTVTAGIISAKGRDIFNNSENTVSSFIQTDAAINSGNSGGALVDIEGNLIGINTAIFSTTGSYAGYGFAIPSNLVKKVIESLK